MRHRRLHPPRSRFRTRAGAAAAVVAAAVLATGLAGCAALAEPERTRPEPVAFDWRPDDLVDHLRLFNAALDDRATGTPAFAQAANYVAARMREAGLHPALGDDFRLLYHTPLNHPAAALVAALGDDTLSFYAGIDHLPDARSDSGTVRSRDVYVDPFAAGAAADAVRGRVVFAPASEATSEYLVRLSEAGAAAAVLVGPLRPWQSAWRADGLVAVQVTFAAAARLLDHAAGFATDRGGTVRLPHTLVLRVAAEHRALAPAINTLGFVAGRHPRRARDLVIVCADLDGAPAFAGVRTLDFEHFGQGAAALLEAARRTAYLAARSTVPERSMLFAVWSGGRLGAAGLRAYLEQPLWPLEATRAVVYVGLGADEEPVVRALLAAHGVPLYVVPPPPSPVADRPAAVFPVSDVRRRAAADGRARRRGDATPGVDLSALIAAAAADALRLAQETVDLAFPLTIVPEPYRPVLEDTLWTPPPADG